MKKSRKEFIKRAHQAACSDWKKLIENEFPKLFTKTQLEVGKWYISTDKNVLYVTKKQNTHGWYESYGFNMDGKWMSGNGQFLFTKGRFKPATDKEVEQALIKEAKRRGFKKGVYFYHNKDVHPSLANDRLLIKGNKFSYYSNGNTLEIDAWEIFTNGKWATPLETITKEEAEKQLGKTILD